MDAINFWDNHGLWFLICITLLPRLTLFLTGLASGGILWWLGFIFAPHVLVAVIASMNYWESNPVLVIISWIFAYKATRTEKEVVVIVKEKVL
jgi:hypothetical protein